ncbi:hypothetical protein ACS0TY_009009 [Phlomoides rotata]
MGCNGAKKTKISRRKSRKCGKKTAVFSVKKLQKIIPGGEGLNPDSLLLRTADYILLLKLQINVLQVLNSLPVS